MTGLNHKIRIGSLFLLVLLALAFSLRSKAAPTTQKLAESKSVPAQSVKVLSFTQWKELQILESQNRVARLNNKVTALKNSPAKASKALKLAEAELKGAEQSVEVAKEFTIEHYAASYVSTLTDSKEALQGLAQVLTPAEMADLLYFLAQNRAASAPSNSKLVPFVSGVPRPSSAL